MTPERIRTLSSAVLLTLFAMVCADIVAHAVASQIIVPPPPAATPAAVAANASGRPMNDGQMVQLTENILAPTPSDVPLNAVPTAAPGQTLSPWDQWLQDPQRSLVLIGTMVGDDMGIAVISANNQQYAIKSGEVLGSWRVLEVGDVDVTFEQSGTRTQSRLTLPMLASSPSPANAAMQPQGIQNRQPLVPPGPTVHVQMRGKTIVLQRPEVNAVIADPGRLMQGVRFDAIAKDGKPQGIIVNYLDPSNLFYSMGLRQGDILTGINDHDLRTQDDAIQAYLILKNEDSLSMRLVRGAEDTTIPVEISP